MSAPATLLAKLMSPQAELSLLASVVRASAEQRVQIATVVREDWFTSADRQLCWRAMLDLVGRSLPIDLTLLQDGLRAQLDSDRAQQLTEHLAGLMPTANLWKTFAETVEGYWVRRQGYEACQQAQARFLDLAHKPAEALEQAESELFALHTQRAGPGMRHVRESLIEAAAGLEEAIANRGYVIGGLPFGFTEIDRSYIRGMRKSHVIMIVAPPGGGKTVAMMKIAWNVATGSSDYHEGKVAVARGHKNYEPHRVGVFSLEMDDVQLAERLLITQSRVELAKMQRGQMSRKEQDMMAQGGERIKHSQLYMEHVPGISIQELRVKARYAVMKHKLDLLCIDYAQLITSSSKAAIGNRTQEMMDVSKGLKLLAQECGVPVIVCAQPKQETWGQRAGLNAMAETAQLAKDADLVMMFGFWDIIAKRMKGFTKGERAQVAGQGDTDDEEEYQDPNDPTVFAYCDLVKNRHGANTTGKDPIKLRWERDFYDFVSTNDRLYDASGEHHQQH